MKDRLGKYLVEKAIEDGVSKKVAPLLRLLLEILVLDLQLLRTGTRLNVSFMRRRAFPKKISIMKALGADVRRTRKADGMIGAQKKLKHTLKNMMLYI